MTAITLLFMQPVEPASKESLIDEATCLMAGALRVAMANEFNKGTYNKGTFVPLMPRRGPHICICGAQSANVDVKLVTGEITNTLAVHYLAHHRSEVPSAVLDYILNSLAAAQTLPTQEELQAPK